MSEATKRFQLPFIIPGQAQKELFHNEALAMADTLLHPAVEAGPVADPPAAPALGQCWLVGAAPTGAWSGKSDALASWTDSGWRFVHPVPGMLVWKKNSAVWVHWTGSAWSGGEIPASKIVIGGQQVVGPRLPAVPSPSGGTVIDLESRAAIAALIVALKSHGLTD
ncbi:DUF2793 domain-containing protein [Allosphingosinicella sp.]|jgi:hypothetical protein|uniref:DUF2793 domain-containing protein n=1 Tax=Allosphingosinicella sp. TaxID=2823234 RepID=UPI002F15CFA8